MSDSKPVLVGESNPYGSDPYYALYPYPPGCAGDRLCRKIMQLDPDSYLEKFHRVNLCQTPWSMKQARVSASALQKKHLSFVLLGQKVTKAFGLEYIPFTKHLTFVILPHPSGLSRAWHDPGSFDRAHRLLSTTGIL